MADANQPEDTRIAVYSHGRGWTAYCPVDGCTETRSNMFQSRARALIAEHVATHPVESAGR